MNVKGVVCAPPSTVRRRARPAACELARARLAALQLPRSAARRARWEHLRARAWPSGLARNDDKQRLSGSCWEAAQASSRWMRRSGVCLLRVCFFPILFPGRTGAGSVLGGLSVHERGRCGGSCAGFLAVGSGACRQAGAGHPRWPAGPAPGQQQAAGLRRPGPAGQPRPAAAAAALCALPAWPAWLGAGAQGAWAVAAGCNPPASLVGANARGQPGGTARGAAHLPPSSPPAGLRQSMLCLHPQNHVSASRERGQSDFCSRPRPTLQRAGSPTAHRRCQRVPGPAERTLWRRTRAGSVFSW
jgi:hypothetical protein